ncbi:arsenate reductase (glutaredoxin) [Robertkochia solimangrovi]|uniref:arsenate reductase (glutaredoxin) n=1 Tax=Robertkochia solimangrovi TaxID=2213046 RepID=UPI00117D40CB|nr:arsenate reductase (glutaredoxin) [Robertkochia solimangrovi]TRZ45369.1 arsenate reductase (glutaredoxin) [Robertkochia solimangrovi]
MIKIYHNPRCRKSREGLQILEESGEQFEVIKYLEDIPSEKELRTVIDCLDIKPIHLVRKNEKVWKEKYDKGKDMTDGEVVKAMLADPVLIERPIVVKNNKAVIGRPPENINSIL